MGCTLAPQTTRSALVSVWGSVEFFARSTHFSVSRYSETSTRYSKTSTKKTLVFLGSTLIVKKKGKEKQISWVRRAVSSVKEECLFSPGMERATREHMYPPQPPTHPLTRHAQMNPVPGDLENSNVLSQPKTSASRDDRNHFYTIEFLSPFHIFFSSQEQK